MIVPIKQILLEDLNFFDTVDGQAAVNKAYTDAANYIQNSPENERNAINQALEFGNRNLADGKGEVYNKLKIGSLYSEAPLDHARRLQGYESANNVQQYADSLGRTQPTSTISPEMANNLKMVGAGTIGAGLAFGLSSRYNRRPR